MNNHQMYQPQKNRPVSLLVLVFACSPASTTLFAGDRGVETDNNQATLQLESLHTTAFESIATNESVLESSQTEPLTLISTPTTIANRTLSLPLNDWRVIQSVSMDVEAIGSDARLEVIVNGEIKASLFIPGHDPYYLVTIADAARSIELRHVSGGRIKVSSLVANVQRKAPVPHHGAFSSKAAQIGIEIIRNSNDFASLTSRYDFERHISPVKIRAGRVYAKATASGDADSELNQLMSELLTQMASSTNFIEQCMMKDQLFIIATKFLENQYKLDELLN